MSKKCHKNTARDATCLSRDIPELSEAEERLEKIERYFLALIENSGDVIMVLNADGTIRYQSPSSKYAFGHKLSERQDKSILEHIDPEQTPLLIEDIRKLSINPDNVLRKELRICDADGSWHWIEAIGSNHLQNPAVEGIILNLHDITESKNIEADQKQLMTAHEEQNAILIQTQLELEKAFAAAQDSAKQLKAQAAELFSKNEELNTTQKQLSLLLENLEERVQERTIEVEKLLKHKDEFIGQLGHDLKSPLTPLVTLLPMIAKQEQNPKLKELLEMSVENVSYMKNLVVKTLALARVSSSTTEFNIEDVSLTQEINKVLSIKRLILDKKAILIENRITEEIMVRADKLRLEELIDNLVSNAINFTPSNGMLTLDAGEKRGTATISIKDTGIGMTKGQTSEVFNEFYKADPSRHELDSSGLGLAICKRIVEKHGGTIWAESKGPDKGSTFCFTLKTTK